MKPIRIAATSFFTFAFVSCATQKANQYDTSNPTGTTDAGAVSAPVNQPTNPIYDTPAAYEASGTTTAPPAAAPAVVAPNRPAPPVPMANTNGAAIIHTVVAGDTLSGISAKYKVPAAAIKQANSMTKDTVVLGKKMVIPPVH